MFLKIHIYLVCHLIRDRISFFKVKGVLPKSGKFNTKNVLHHEILTHIFVQQYYLQLFLRQF